MSTQPIAFRCGRTCGCDEPCEYAERRAEERSDEYAEWPQADLDEMADMIAAKMFGGGRG